MVDLDDGSGEATLRRHVGRALERCGASGVVLEDQARNRPCSHLARERLLPLLDDLAKLDAVQQARSSLLVVAGTDASGDDAALRNALAGSEDLAYCQALPEVNLAEAARA